MGTDLQPNDPQKEELPMGDTSLLSLQNGSDIRGTAMGPHTDLTGSAVNRIAQAFVLWLSEKSGKAPEMLTINFPLEVKLSAVKSPLWEASPACAEPRL